MDNVFLKPDNNILISWEFDNNNIINSSYNIINDTNINVTNFSHKENYLPTDNDQLFIIDPVYNTYGKSSLLHLNKLVYLNPPSASYDTVKIYLPINYNFNNYPGFYINIKTLGYDNTFSNILNYYFDYTDLSKSNQIQILSQPLKYENRLWGKYIELKVPSIYEQSRLRDITPNRPTPGTINYNLAINSNGLSQTAPIFIDFHWIELIKTENNIKKFVLLNKFQISTPQAPSNLTLGVNIEHSKDGDYYEFYGTYGNSINEFANFMQSLELNGQKSYIIYTISTFEQNVQTSSIDYYVYKDFEIKNKFRPIFNFSNTTGSLQVQMKIISYVDGSSIIKINELLLEPYLLSKYGNKLMSINVNNIIKPNILNAKPDQIIINPTILESINRRNNTNNNTLKYVQVPIIANNIMIKDLTTNLNNVIKQDELEIIIHPYDNVLKFSLLNSVNDTLEPFKIENISNVFLNFKGLNNTISVSMDVSSTENNPGLGVLIFNIKSSDALKIAKIFTENNRFYITQKDNNNELVLYSGIFIPSDSNEYLNRIKKVAPPTLPNVNMSPGVTVENKIPNTSTSTSGTSNIAPNVTNTDIINIDTVTVQTDNTGVISKPPRKLPISVEEPKKSNTNKKNITL